MKTASQNITAGDVLDELICSLHILPLDFKTLIQDTICPFILNILNGLTPIKASPTQFIWFHQYYLFSLSSDVQIIENQLLAFMNDNSMFVSFQSTFRSHHRTETALSKTTNDLILLTCDVPLFYLSTNVSYIDHLLAIFREMGGLHGTAFYWLSHT